MLFIKSLLLLFITSAQCSPIYSSGNIFNIGCVKPIHQDLDIMQGLKPNLKNHIQFGYIYTIDSPKLDVSSDIPIKHLEHNIWGIPSKATAILSGIAYNKLNSKLILTSRISNSNANNLNLAPLDSVNIKFGTFVYDKSTKEWHNSLKNGNLGGINGKVTKSNIVHQRNGIDSHYELILEMIPLKSVDKVQFLKYFVGSATTEIQIKWDGLARNGCKKVGSKNIVSNRRDHFNEIFENAVLL